MAVNKEFEQWWEDHGQHRLPTRAVGSNKEWYKAAMRVAWEHSAAETVRKVSAGKQVAPETFDELAMRQTMRVLEGFTRGQPLRSLIIHVIDSAVRWRREQDELAGKK